MESTISSKISKNVKKQKFLEKFKMDKNVKYGLLLDVKLERKNLDKLNNRNKNLADLEKPEIGRQKWKQFLVNCPLI